jgi:hypothetical protein
VEAAKWKALRPRRPQQGHLAEASPPVNARIEFDAYAESPDGDLKVELWGDGVSGATGNSYTNATSYLAILGGWKNTKHVLARLDEHGDDRLEFDDRQEQRRRARPSRLAWPGLPLQDRAPMARRVSWSVNGVEYFELSPTRSPSPARGTSTLGFNDWDAPVCFDNLKITPL